LRKGRRGGALSAAAALFTTALATTLLVVGASTGALATAAGLGAICQLFGRRFAQVGDLDIKVQRLAG